MFDYQHLLTKPALKKIKKIDPGTRQILRRTRTTIHRLQRQSSPVSVWEIAKLMLW